ncbi:DUF2752 domain-containing protein [Flavobacterium sp. xlx-214]|uniref:DUF2752 domain-containing protein n=1 Tax=unclassified Flavobacterium TaxID=196869 RepID=UPI0013D58A5D|nr:MULTISPECIES: DUF2752 domain-containing protein [unclassified Flavobacterium]MBA5791798.1 DUF2752 domain-containing protein [Flavobacterium sp. xlx-221]QMI83035.1 DUF2752 domain-containing protein [Flavobacterium sp. xlx-214]
MDVEDLMLPCMNKKIFGVECLGCGTQRAAYLLMQGDFVGAFKMFPAIYTTLLLFLFLFLHFIDKKRNYHKLIIFFAITNAVITVFAYIYKRI